MPLKETCWSLAKDKENQHKNARCRHFSSLMCFVMPHIVLKFGLIMFCELFIISSRHSWYLLINNSLSYCVTCVLETFTGSLCSKPPPPSLVIMWCKVLFFKTCISGVSTVFLKKIENHKFSILSSFLVPKMSHFFQNSSNTTLIEINLKFVFSKFE